MKKKNVTIILSVTIILLIIIIPILINMSFKYNFNILWLESEWSAGDAIGFYGAILSFLGTITLGIISLWQTNEANKISNKLLEKDLLETSSVIQLQNKFEIDVKHNNDTKITMSTNHKPDHGASILLESVNDNPVKFNQHLLKLYFQNSSEKINIKRIMLDYVLCVQDPEKEGFVWEDNSNDPIPIGLDIKFGNEVLSNWISNNEFFIQFKIYSNPDGCFTAMMENKAKTCILFGLKLYNLSNVETKMEFKIWLFKDKNGNIKVLNTSSNFY